MVQRVYEEAEFNEIIDRVPLEIRQSLTFEQRAAISQAVLDSRRKHAVDIRFVIPLIFTQLYFVLFIGNDRRRAVQAKLLERRNDAGRWGLAGILAVGAVAMVLFLAVGAYVAKSRAGIDLLPNAHGSDLAKGLGVR